MKKVLLGVLIGGLGVAGWSHLHRPVPLIEEPGDPSATGAIEPEPFERESAAASPISASFSCDGRKYCSQMTSCEEAEFFLQNCPGVKMDGGGDGVPCERQWCGNR